MTRQRHEESAAVKTARVEVPTLDQRYPTPQKFDPQDGVGEVKGRLNVLHAHVEQPTLARKDEDLDPVSEWRPGQSCVGHSGVGG